MIDQYKTRGPTATDATFVVGAEISENTIGVYFNNHLLHTAAHSLALAQQSSIDHGGISVTNHPVPHDGEKASASSRKDPSGSDPSNSQLFMLLSFVMPFVCCSYIVITVTERQTKFKHLQVSCFHILLQGAPKIA